MSDPNAEEARMTEESENPPVVVVDISESDLFDYYRGYLARSNQLMEEWIDRYGTNPEPGIGFGTCSLGELESAWVRDAWRWWVERQRGSWGIGFAVERRPKLSRTTSTWIHFSLQLGPFTADIYRVSVYRDRDGEEWEDW